MRKLAATLPAFAVALTLFALAPSPTAAAELAGVQMADSTRAGDTTLVLNGLGLRKKAIFKVYVGGLYLESKQTDTSRILAHDGPRRMVMHFVRSVGKGSIADAWTDCLAANTPDASAEVKGQFGKLSGWMDDVSDDDQLVFTYVPGEGTAVEVKGTAKGTLEGKPFADALLACWIGPEPPSDDFRAGLLGQ